MSNTDSAYCRLCAELKTNNKLFNIDVDEDNRRDIIEKLNVLHTPIDFNDEKLPKTVCFVCINVLNTASEFVVSIEKAQAVLNDLILVQNIKKEATFSDNESLTYDHSDEVKYDETTVSIKLEAERDDLDIKPDLKNEDKPKISRKIKKKCRKVRSINLDAIPLSQLKVTWENYTWTCSYCETQFSNVDELQSHSMQFHNTCNAYRCTDCNIRKMKLDSFLIHIKRHSHRKNLKLSCYKCNKTFSMPQDTNAHKRVHITSQHVCPGCNTNFQNIEELNEHTNTYFRDKRSRHIPTTFSLNDDLSCLLCKKTFKHKGSLNTHLLIHTERKRDHTCDKCGKCFLNKQNLAGHMLLHDDKRPFKCEICKAGFKTSGQLRSHVGVHNGVKPFACDQCGKCFRLQKQLTSHSIIHTDALPHVCSYCNKGFRFKTILNQHIRQHTGVKPYSCDICQRDFTNWPNYNKHMKRRHGMDMAKKKHTPEGVYPINPTTGEIIIYPETNKTLEWKKQMMAQRRPGRPKMNDATKVLVSNELNNEAKTESTSVS